MADKHADKDDNVKRGSFLAVYTGEDCPSAVIKKADRQIYYFDGYLCSIVWNYISGLFLQLPKRQ